MKGESRYDKKMEEINNEVVKRGIFFHLSKLSFSFHREERISLNCTEELKISVDHTDNCRQTVKKNMLREEVSQQ